MHRSLVLVPRACAALLCLSGWPLAGCSAPVQPHVATSSPEVVNSPKKVVSEFYVLAFVQGRVADAAAKYISDSYTQHNPEVADGRQAFVDALSPLYAKSSGLKVTIRHVVADGDIVVVHALQEAEGEPATAVADIFRVADGKIVEHWDVQQPVPAHTASGHPMV